MVACLLGLGSNMGDREATLAAALVEIDDLPDVRLAQRSGWHRSTAVGGPAGQPEFLNAAAVVETSLAPLRLLDELQDIERRHGRQRGDRWAPRPLDIDILLYGNEVAETEMLTLPHPRMSFRPFVLEPAAEVAPRMLHPVIGWPVERLLLHLAAASDQLAILSPSATLRDEVAGLVVRHLGAEVATRPSFGTAEQHWPAELTTWLAIQRSEKATRPAAASGASPPYAAAAFPKLTVLLDAPSQTRGAAKAQWSVVVRRPGRGPLLRLQAVDRAVVEAEVLAAVEAVWPDLGPVGASRLE